ncbi:50S ribosomal protein L31 [Rhynchospora pubera]|uniref:Large ribosomal subunit protein bL31c n=1 Tax=Rhynchospora pubera TaxID=906938 RepID=A0AAV8GSY1_9POAL|nr:50S ribosomal protein L31 [Rhynchospora pubera]
MALSLKTPFLPTTIITPSRTTTKRLSLPIKMKVECRKKGLHPKFFEECKVYCDGELVLVTSGTQKELTIDTWSGNHPFYLGESLGFDDDSYFNIEEWAEYELDELPEDEDGGDTKNKDGTE